MKEIKEEDYNWKAFKKRQEKIGKERRDRDEKEKQENNYGKEEVKERQKEKSRGEKEVTL